MSLLGVWTKTPPARAAGGLPPPLAARPDRGRDKVPPLYLLALVGRADNLTDGLVGIDAEDLDLAEEFRSGTLAEQVELVPGDQAIIRADGDLDHPVLTVDPGHLAPHRGRALDALEGADVVGQSVLPQQGLEPGHAVAEVVGVVGRRLEHPAQLADLVVQLGLTQLELVGLLLDGRLLLA